jgi:thioesterase domain-containing protein
MEAGWEGASGFKALVGGEALAADLAQQLLARSSEVWNLYGPTETTIWSTCWRVEPGAAISIGRPIANTTVHILDEHGQSCPIGVAGEICIGGEGVALGYLDRPQLTAERFIPDASATDPDARLYRTGDHGRWRHDGRLEHLGRLDQQVKLRGHRIELGEIETNLASHTDIAQCLVVIREDRPGDARIVAYTVAKAGRSPTAASLREHLRRSLPDYMIPQHFAPLGELPLLPNGKVDRQALPAPEASTAPAPDHVSPRSETEAILAGIWSEVLGVDQVSVHDSFFDLGGHSLLALKLSQRIEQQLKRTIRLATLFDAPTVSRLAMLLSGTSLDTPETCAVAINAKGSRAPLFFVSGWGGAIMGFKALAHELHPEQPLYVLDTTKFGSPTHPIGTLPEIAAQMIRDVRRIQPQGPYHLCGFSQGGKFVYEMAQNLFGSGQTVGMLALMDCDAPGYPRTRPAFSRVMMHLRLMLRQGWSENMAYLGSRLTYFYRHLTRKDEDLFAEDADIAASSAAKAIQASADAMSKAWEDYTPAPYPGRMLLIRAGIRDVRPSLIDDDPLLGWDGTIGDGVALRTMDAHHVKMIAPEHAAELAAVLSEFLEGSETAADGRAWTTRERSDPATRALETTAAVS